MSDRTPSSVRAESRRGDVPGQDSPAPDRVPAGDSTEVRSASTTQAIPTTGSLRAQGAGAAPSGSGSTGDVRYQGVPVGKSNAPATGRPGGVTPPVDSGRGRGRGKPKGGRGPRRAKLQLRHIDTWSAFKISLVLSIALFFIWMVAIGILYGVLNGLGVFSTLNDLFGQLGSASGSKGHASAVITPGIVFGGAAVIGAINIVLLTALCTVATFIYNLCADLVGGLEVTLSERD